MSSKIYTVTVADDDGTPVLRARLRATRHPFDVEALEAWFSHSISQQGVMEETAGLCPSCGTLVNQRLTDDLLLRVEEEAKLLDVHRGNRFDDRDAGLWIPVESAVAARPVNDLDGVSHDGPAAGLGYSWGTVVASCKWCRGDGPAFESRESLAPQRRAVAVAGLYRGLSTEEGGSADPGDEHRTVDGGFEVLDEDGLRAVLKSRHEALVVPDGLAQYS